MPDFSLEEAVRTRAKNPSLVVVGLDEVGTGCLAGPVFAGAVILDPTPKDWYSRLGDSKKIRPRERRALHDIIIEEAVAWSVGWVSEKEIDEVGISTARRRAMLMAFADVKGEKPIAAVVDDTRLAWLRADFGKASLFVNRADDRSLSVAAASIVAKVLRDKYMRTAAVQYGNYGFERNVGYGTPEHLAALKNHGPCPLHRRSFAPVRREIESRS